MAKYKPQIRQDETTVVDLDICAKYDGEGNDIVETYAKKGETSHYEAHNYIGAKDTQANGATTNGNTYLKLYESGAKRSQFNIKGTGATTVTSDKDGNVTIHSSGTAASNTVPKAAGTAAIGTELAFARGDHVHPAQENISGNAGTATKLAAARTITLSGDVSGSIIFDGSKNVTITTTVNAISTEDINTICSQVILNSEDVDL